MKREQKSLTNKGFSLVELIIVVAIMAVLIGVLAPQYLRYVEKTRLQRDNTGISDFANVLKIAATEENVNTEITTSGLKFTFTQDANDEWVATAPASGGTNLVAEVNKTVHLTDIKLSSNTYVAAGTKPEITVKLDSNKIVTVECAHWFDAPDATGDTTKTF